MAGSKSFPVGKLPPEILEALLEKCAPPKGSRVVLGPRFGEDAAVIDWGAKYLVVKSDPITFTADHLGWYGVNINANDVATMGARPRWFLATLLLPEGRTTARLARWIFNDTLRACRALGVTLCGGHTEITAGLSRPILVGQMLGEVEKSKLVRKDRQRPGDFVLLTKGIALEGTAILAQEKSRELARRLGPTLVRRAARLLFDPGISVLPEARLAARNAGVHAMHDPTEGGLLAGLYELGRAGRVGLQVWRNRVPLLPQTRAFSKVLGFDPFGLIASGALLVVASRSAVPGLLRALSRRKISTAVIGKVQHERQGIEMIEGDRSRPLRPPARDELARLLEP